MYQMWTFLFVHVYTCVNACTPILLSFLALWFTLTFKPISDLFWHNHILNNFPQISPCAPDALLYSFRSVLFYFYMISQLYLIPFNRPVNSRQLITWCWSIFLVIPSSSRRYASPFYNCFFPITRIRQTRT